MAVDQKGRRLFTCLWGWRRRYSIVGIFGIVGNIAFLYFMFVQEAKADVLKAVQDLKDLPTINAQFYLNNRLAHYSRLTKTDAHNIHKLEDGDSMNDGQNYFYNGLVIYLNQVFDFNITALFVKGRLDSFSFVAYLPGDSHSAAIPEASIRSFVLDQMK